MSNSSDASGNGEDGGNTLPAASIEQGASASTFAPNPDAPEGSVAQIEILPDEDGSSS